MVSDVLNNIVEALECVCMAFVLVLAASDVVLGLLVLFIYLVNTLSGMMH